MRRLLTIAAALLAFVGAAHALDDDFKEEQFRLSGAISRVWTDAAGGVEIRKIPGWQLDPNCPRERWGEGECKGGQGYFLFQGRWDRDVWFASCLMFGAKCDNAAC